MNIKLRKKLTNRKWVQERFDKYVDETEKLERFRKFECSEFFVGKTKATINLIKYYNRIQKVENHINFLHSILNQIQ